MTEQEFLESLGEKRACAALAAFRRYCVARTLGDACAEEWLRMVRSEGMDVRDLPDGGIALCAPDE